MDHRPQGSDYLSGPVVEVRMTPWGQMIEVPLVPCLICCHPTPGRFTTLFGLTYAVCPEDAVTYFGVKHVG